jgi:serine protease AprX
MGRILILLVTLLGCGATPAAVLYSPGPGSAPPRVPVRVLANLAMTLTSAPAGQPLDVIVTFNRPLERLDRSVLPWTRHPACLERAFPPAAAVACRLNRAQLDALARTGAVAQMEADAEVHATRETSNLTFGTTAARAEFGLTGDGDGELERFSSADHTIAILDTGIDTQHVDFDGGKVIAWRDFVNSRPDPYDDNGHGTHVASIAAGRGVGGVTGVAPGAALVGLKVLRKSGAGRTSDIAAALQYCVDQRDILGIRVINMSLGNDTSSDGTDLGSRAVDQAVAAGIVVVVAGGNDGPITRTIGSPAASRGAITVGSMADVGKGGFALSPFSSRGPTVDGRIKPDLLAPGEGIVAARANTRDGTARLSGTSMASPFVAGVAALMLEANPDLTPVEVKQILMRTAVDFGVPGRDIDYGAGRLDAYQAISTAIGALADPTRFSALHAESAAPYVPPTHWIDAAKLDLLAQWQRPLLVTTTQYPIAATLLISAWSHTEGPHFTLRLLDPDGQVVGESKTDRREERVRFTPTQTGVYTLQVLSRTGASTFILDVSGGLPLSPLDDGSFPAGLGDRS